MQHRPLQCKDVCRWRVAVCSEETRNQSINIAMCSANKRRIRESAVAQFVHSWILPIAFNIEDWVSEWARQTKCIISDASIQQFGFRYGIWKILLLTASRGTRIKLSVAVTERATTKLLRRYLDYYWTDGLAAYHTWPITLIINFFRWSTDQLSYIGLIESTFNSSIVSYRIVS